MSACGNMKDVEEKKVAAKWGPLPQNPSMVSPRQAGMAHGCRASQPTPQCPFCGPEVDEIIAGLGLCRGTVRTSTLYSRTKKPGRHPA